MEEKDSAQNVIYCAKAKLTGHIFYFSLDKTCVEIWVQAYCKRRQVPTRLIEIVEFIERKN